MSPDVVEARTKWTIVSGNKVAMRNGKVAWTYDKADAESWALSVGGTVIACDELKRLADDRKKEKKN